MKKSIWIVDDDAGIIEVTQIILSEAGYDVKTLSTEKELFNELKNNRPHLLLLDVLISGSNGADIAKKLKLDANTSSIPIVMMSADTHIAEKTAESGADAFIQKPFDIDDFEKTIKKYLRQKSS